MGQSPFLGKGPAYLDVTPKALRRTRRCDALSLCRVSDDDINNDNNSFSDFLRNTRPRHVETFESRRCDALSSNRVSDNEHNDNHDSLSLF